jgi:hypothetical protein
MEIISSMDDIKVSYALMIRPAVCGYTSGGLELSACWGRRRYLTSIETEVDGNQL